MSANRKTEWSVGAFIAMGFACALALAFASTNSRSGVSGETYRVTARFTNAGELKVRAPVKIAGVKVGEVAEVNLDPLRFDAIATLRISRTAGDIPADTSAAIYTSGLLGDRYIGLTPGGDPEPLHEGDEILLTQSAVVLEQLIGKYMFGNAEGDGGSSSATATETTQ
ncbi:MAG: putative phospholipid ABC transporter-binding protein MlaD [Alphaproteobacteria bacterium ADurb.BinA280]|jgi:phospholipid/cholesterol/gamma-HCH transport system substrate-binding protein|nr:outer membrane lipid asymmetry maintenance protein MlaD [Aquimonas sp.]OPZ10478.1 MAG: putative phospholipid ABC transporter-binding protein MlaD [Alphaproteobacteria bacterium ADurb.BinA280]